MYSGWNHYKTCPCGQAYNGKVTICGSCGREHWEPVSMRARIGFTYRKWWQVWTWHFWCETRMDT